MPRYWVIGGVYADTGFARIAGGGPETRIGPFENHADAQAAWQERAWATVDDAHARWRIEEEGEDLPYWVVGGSYTDTHFRVIADPGGETWYGPIKSFEEAKAVWQDRAWATVDDALARYRIERRKARP